MATAKRKAKVKADVSIGALTKAKSVYAERGDVNSCGDWLALALKEHCHSEDGFDIGKFECVLKENDIDLEHRPGNSRLDRKVSYERTPKASSSRAKTDTFLSVVKRSERPERRSAVESQKRL
jgi:hypothetical protein